MMSEKRFIVESVEIIDDCNEDKSRIVKVITDKEEIYSYDDLYEISDLLNEQQELIEELHISDHMGWGRAEKFEKELKQKKIYIKRLEYKVQKFKEENEQLRLELETHKHPLWSTREAERKLSEVTDNLADEVKKNGLLNEELNQLRIENMRLKKKGGEWCMTRFTFVCDDENCRFKDNGETIDCVEVVDLLNKLYEENKQLKK